MGFTDVGYKKPPRHSRFQKGKSGNPSGRPKGKRNFATVLWETLHEEIVIKERGKPRKITKLEAALKQLTNKAASGDLNAARLMIALVRSIEERSDESPTKELSEDDLKVMHRVLERHKTCLKGGPGDSQ